MRDKDRKIGLLVLLTCLLLLPNANAISATPTRAPVDSLMAAAGGDTVMVLVSYIEDLQMDLRLSEIAHAALERDLEREKETLLEQLLTDPRLWFCIGAGLALEASD